LCFWFIVLSVFRDLAAAHPRNDSPAVCYSADNLNHTLLTSDFGDKHAIMHDKLLIIECLIATLRSTRPICVKF